MPKPGSKRQMLSARISQLEEELKNLPDNLFLDDDDYDFPSNSGKDDFPENLDADFFDIEMEPGSSKDKSWKLESKRGKDNIQFHFRGRGRGQIRGRGRGARGRASIYRGSYVPSFRPQENNPLRTQNLYNDDEEDWSRYVSQSVDSEERSSRDIYKKSISEEHFDPSISSKYESRFEKSDWPSPKENKYSRFSDSSKIYKEDTFRQEDKDMFFFPNEKVPEVNEKNPPKATNAQGKGNESESKKASEVMSIFEELQAKLSSTPVPGLDILSETLKKLEQLKEDQKGQSASKEKGDSSKIETKGKDQIQKPISFSIPKSLSKLDKRSEIPVFKSNTPPLAELSKNSKQKNVSEKEEHQKLEKADLKTKDLSPSRKVFYTGTQKRDISPSHHREISPTHKREQSPGYRKRDSLSPSRKRHISPSRKRHSPSPRRRRSPRYSRSPSPRRRRESNSPRRRRRGSVSPYRRREYDSPSRKRRDSDWYSRHSPKRRRSRSRSPRKDFRRRSSSRSPHRRGDHYSKRKDSPISLSPTPERKMGHRRLSPIPNAWYHKKHSNPVDPLQQPKPPGGENSDVYAEINYNPPAATAPTFDSGVRPPYTEPGIPRSAYPPSFPYDPPSSQYYPAFQQTPSGVGPPIGGVGPPSNVGPPPGVVLPPVMPPPVRPSIIPQQHPELMAPMVQHGSNMISVDAYRLRVGSVVSIRMKIICLALWFFVIHHIIFV
ncbi:hypothetical protein J6590_108832 [Homalodisca vitripennis]|nr:hypothetical protein J6590_108832 [Homalodisca vitripennis]